MSPACPPVPPASAPAPQLIRARSDDAAARLWLARYQHSPHTLRAYQRELRRFFGWLGGHGLTLAQLTLEDAAAYLDWLRQPPAALTGKKTAHDSAAWRPFHQPLAERSRRHSHSVLLSLFRFLNDASYLHGNPFALQPRQALPQAPQERYLDAALWQKLQHFLQQQLPAQPGVSAFHAARCQWLFTLLYHSAARLGEICDARMGSFLLRDGRWWLRVRGKGRHSADIPVSDTLLAALRHYRRQLQLPDYPAPDEPLPLIPRQRGDKSKALGCQAVHLIVKQTFQRFAAQLQQHGDAAGAARVAGMSAHWLRHTSASHQLAAGIPLLQVSHNLRHAKLDTTRIYLHLESEERHAAMRDFGKN